MGEYERRTLITFSCGHSRLFANPAPKQGETLWCLRCRNERTAISAPNSWKIKCRNCIYSRDFGQAELNSQISAAKHRMKYPHHIVDIFNGQTIKKTFGIDRNQTVIGSFPDSDPGPGF